MRKISTFLVFLLSVLLLPSICAGQHEVASLVQKLEDYIQDKYIPGAMISIVKADTVIFVGGIGYANIEKEEEVTDQHLFRQGSISKSFTALGLFHLLSKSPFDLTTPIRRIDPTMPFSNSWEGDSPVEVAHLLEHTSGFDDFHLHAMYNTKDTELPLIRSMVEDHRQSLYARWRPGTKKAYSNPNYIVAGHLIEVLSNTKFDVYIDEKILKPMKIESSGFYFKQPGNKLFATGYQKTGKQLNPIPFTTINGSPAGDFCANAKDMASYLQFMLNRDSTLFSNREYDRIESPRTSLAAKMGLPSGYGLGNYTIYKNGYIFHGHGGEIEGFAARYMYSREADIGVAVAINRNGNANEMLDEILDALVSSPQNPATPRTIHPVPEAFENKFSGFYEFNSPKNELLAFSERLFGGFILDFEENMVIRKRILGRPRDTLYYAGNNQFYLGNEGLPSAMTIAAPRGKPAFWINDNYTEKESRSKRLIIIFGLLFSFLILTSFFIYSLVWLIRNRISGNKKNAINHLVLFGAGLSLSLVLTGFALTLGNIQSSMTMTFPALLMYMSSYALVLLSLIAAYRCFKLPGSGKFKAVYVLGTLSTLAITAYLWEIGFIGLKLWSY